MRFFLHLLLLASLTWMLPAGRSQDDPPMKSALETNAKGFNDLPLDSTAWRRLSAQYKGKVAAKSPWTFDKDSIEFDGVSPEMLVHNKLETNGILHAEWRYKKPPAKGSASGGLVVRVALDSSVWHEALAGNKAGGIFIGQTTIDGKPAKVPSGKQPGPLRVKDVGEWNIYEVTFKDKTLSLFANGYIAAEWPLCDVPKGYAGLKGDGAPIEFKNIKFKRLR